MLENAQYTTFASFLNIEYKALVKEADKKIEEDRKRRAEAMMSAKDCIAR